MERHATYLFANIKKKTCKYLSEYRVSHPRR